jgi:WhiB family redox-sensing transcriptional regulator
MHVHPPGHDAPALGAADVTTEQTLLNYLKSGRNPGGWPSVSCEVWPETTEGVVRMDWRHRALCRDEDPELFFPIGTTGPAERQVEEAKAVCRRCTVTTDCLNWALDTGQDAGVWGGLSEDERRALKRQVRLRVRTA